VKQERYGLRTRDLALAEASWLSANCRTPGGMALLPSCSSLSPSWLACRRRVNLVRGVKTFASFAGTRHVRRNGFVFRKHHHQQQDQHRSRQSDKKGEASLERIRRVTERSPAASRAFE
jgi:hypothetical protein